MNWFSKARFIESEWQKKWRNSRIFETEPNQKKPKFYMVFAYPTTSGALHVGHARSYTIPDVIARFKRMQGFNVFFPLGFHATGLDCINIHEKITNNPEYGERYGISVKTAEKLKTPIAVEKYLEKVIFESLLKLGVSVNLRPIVSTIDSAYNKFVQWQFKKLRELGYLVQNDYYLPWCPSCGHPVSLDAAEADVSEWKGATVKEYTVIKFRDNKGTIFPASTLRPETIFGVTNLWLNPNGQYVEAKINEETWITSKESFQKLKDQGKNVEVISEKIGKVLNGTEVINPVTGDLVKVLMAEFVNPDEASGVVMSVPAHDPYDYLCCKTQYSNIKPIQVINVEGMSQFPAKDVLERFGARKTTDPRLNEAVKELYKAENNGRIISSIQTFGNMNTVKAREALKEHLSKLGAYDKLFELSVKPVFCRCGAEIIVKVIKGQWFINYADLNWKKKAEECAANIKTYPPEYMKQLPETIAWLSLRPCVRKRGLGTEFPFEDGWIIEALSDSTIYMAFYIVTKYLNTGLITEQNLTDEFFDYVFLSRIAPTEASKATGVSEELLIKIRQEFEYWYPLDLNAGGKEHLMVHFPFFIFNHVAIFPKKYWPEGIFVNWHLVAYGQKMSKHLGNTIFLDDALRKWTADTIRLYLLHGSNQWRDFDWKNEDCNTYMRHLERFNNLISEILKAKVTKDNIMDAWLRTVVNKSIHEVTDFLENGEVRKAVDTTFFGIWNDIDWYRRRTNSKGIPHEHVKTWLKLLAPFIPHVCEEIWHNLGETEFISLADWPILDEKSIDRKVVQLEETLKRTIEDVKHVSELTGRKDNLYLYTVSNDEFKYFVQAKEFLQRELRLNKIKVFNANDKGRYDPENKARKALLRKPGIYLE